MAVARPILGFVSLILIAGAILLIFLTLLAGANDHNPVNKVYFLEASTAGIPGAASLTRWTFWNACSVVDGHNSCPKVHPAYPLNPPGNFDGADTNIPQQFLGTKHYYYLTRFMFAFVLIGLFFAVVSLFLGIFALCFRFGSFISSGLVSIALFFQTLTAALMTAAYVQGRNAFRSNNQSANIGRYGFGFMWAAVACLFLSTVFLCAGGAASGSRGSTKTKSSGGGFFGRRSKSTRSNRNRGSFIDKETPLTNDA